MPMTKSILYLVDHASQLEASLRMLGELRQNGLTVTVCPDSASLNYVSAKGWEKLSGSPVVSAEAVEQFYGNERPLAVLMDTWRPRFRKVLEWLGAPVLLKGANLPKGLPPRSAVFSEFSGPRVGLHLESFLQPQQFAGKTVVVTAGPTVEDIDPVRFLTNRSSGKMGMAIAVAAAMRGAKVMLIHGPMQASVPIWPSLEDIPVRSAQQMHDAVRDSWSQAQVAILCAAVADFRPDHYVPQKIKKIEGEGMVLSLERTPDILAELGAMPNHPFLVGFAAETDDVEINALNKLRKKHCDMLCANDIRKPGSGFAVDTNQITIYASDGMVRALPMLSKQAAAYCILDEVARRMN